MKCLRSTWYRSVAIGVALSGVFWRPEAAAQSCLNYEPTVVEVSGTVSVEEAYGPPICGADPATDAKERYLLLTPDAPICVNSGPDDLVNSEAEAELESLQLLYRDAYPFRQEWLGRRVIVAGTLFHAHTGHHRTPVLMTVAATKLADGQ